MSAMLDFLASAAAPWWAVPVFGLLTAVLTWVLGGVSARRASAEAALARAEERKRAAYLEFWEAIVMQQRGQHLNDRELMMEGNGRAARALFSIELVGSPAVLEAATAAFTATGQNRQPEDAPKWAAPTREFRRAAHEDLHGMPSRRVS